MMIDFIVIGAQKAGTTTLFEYLRRHPDVFVPPNKEVPYFSHDRAWSRGWDDYLRKSFPAATRAGRRCGTVTPQYMVGGVYEAERDTIRADHRYDERTVPLRIRERLPEVRLVAILRDPVERARSHYLMAVLQGRERRGFEQTIDELLRPEALERSRKQPEETTGYITWGEYGRILGGYFSVFDPEQILVVLTTDLERRPMQLLRRVFGFIGVASDFTPDNIGARYRENSVARRYSWLNADTLQEAVTYNAAARSIWHRLPESSRRRIDFGYRRIGYNLDLWNRRDKADATGPDPPTLARLRAHFVQDADLVASLTGLQPTWRRTVDAP